MANGDADDGIFFLSFFLSLFVLSKAGRGQETGCRQDGNACPLTKLLGVVYLGLGRF